MLDPSNSLLPVILWVDHETEAINAIIERIGAMTCTNTTMQPLNKDFKLTSIVVEPGENQKDIVLDRIKPYLGKASLILVDLNFEASHTPEGIHKGRKLAMELDEALYPIPIGVYTKYDLPLRERALISSDRFAVQIEDLHKLSDGPKRIFGDDWKELFQTVIAKATKTIMARPRIFAASIGGSIVSWADGHPRQGTRSFLEAGPKLVSKALEWLDPPAPEIMITQLGGGFSGSYLIKAKAVNSDKQFVVKIDEDPRRLLKELEGNRRVRTLIDYRFLVPLSAPDTTKPVSLTDDWWGAFVMDFEGEAKPLIECAHIDGSLLASIYSRLWNKCLKKLYGSMRYDSLEMASIVSEDIRSIAIQGFEGIKRYSTRFSDLENVQFSKFDRFLTYITDPGDGPRVFNNSLNAPWVERVHGDLNCRNILYDTSDDTFRLIDFPHVGPPHCLAFDFVKAEAELILIMMDWETGYDCDFLRIRDWDKLLEALSLEFLPTNVDFGDDEINRISEAVLSIRNAYLSFTGNSADAIKAYQLLLLPRVLRYIVYSDISIPKRYLAVLWAGELLQLFD